ncbi:MAG: galactose-1-phosphate uridylyltransferase [Actinomycetota bacterium]|nr:galactose-1-phosphate uridylyltransferase [Actinomycetota bacterium]
MWKSSTRLADGREIVYFDESPGLGREQVADTRPLPPRPPGPALPTGSAESGIRWDPLAGEWVVIAAARQDRTFLPPPDQCPLDPSAPGRLTEIPADSYDVVVFENRFPSLREPLGRCEVVCFTSDHNSSFARLSPARVRTVFEAWVDRTRVLSALPGTEQVYCFENRGEEIGVTLHHPHGQIYAFPFVTPRTERMVTQVRGYNGDNLFDDLVAAELRAGERIVVRNEHWIAFVPEAARWPYEVQIFPSVRVPDLPATSEAARDAFGPLYLDVLRRFDALFGQPAPYIAGWHQAPVNDETTRRQFAAHLQVLSVRRAAGKLKYLAGTESGMGVWINDIVPEEAAQRLREA